MDEKLIVGINSFLLATSIATLCSSLVDAILSPIIQSVLSRMNIDLDSYNSNGIKVGTFIKALITFSMIYFLTVLLQKFYDSKSKDNKK